MKTTRLSKVPLDTNDISIIKAYANHLKNVVNPYLKHEKIKTTKILYQIARSLGYRNYEEIKKTCTNKILFTDVYLYLSKIVESVLFELLDPEDLTNAKEKENISNLSKHASNTFVYQDVSHYLTDLDPPSAHQNISTLLVPITLHKYEVILFRSYVELVLRLEKLRHFDFAMNCIEDNKLMFIEAPIIQPVFSSNFPVYSYIEKLLPTGSLFIVNKNEKVIGFEYINDEKILQDFNSESILLQLAFTYPASFTFQLKKEKNSLICECLSLGFEGKMRLPNNHEMMDRDNSDGKIIVVEAVFTNPLYRKKIDLELTYKEYCDKFIKKTLNIETGEFK